MKKPAKGQTQAETLLSLASSAELFHDPDGHSFATVPVKGHHETWPIRSRSFRRWLTRRFYESHKRPPAPQALQGAIETLEAKAQFDGREEAVFTRLAQKGHAMYLDLCNVDWQAVQISSDGWQVVKKPPVKFRRTKGMRPLPLPVKGGSVEELRRFVNTSGDDDWCLVLGWLIGAFQSSGPFPVLVLHGEHGAAKSTAARVLRSLVDPNTASSRSEPRDTRDLMIAAKNGWIVSFDNLSHLDGWLSDDLCRLATGGGFATRQLYTDDEEALFHAMRPVVLNGIEELTTRSDLLDRTLLIWLPEIPEDRREEERHFWGSFEEAWPGILGALLTGVSAALRNRQKVKLPKKPRMADFAVWVTAAEAGLGLPEGSFLRAYNQNRENANDVALESSPVAQAVLWLVSTGEPFEGTASELLDRLNESCVTPIVQRGRSWPKTPGFLSSRLRRLAPNLRAMGVQVKFDRTSGQRTVRIELMRESASPSSPSSSLPPEADSTSAAHDAA